MAKDRVWHHPDNGADILPDYLHPGQIIRPQENG
jgi:hypothetical protein